MTISSGKTKVHMMVKNAFLHHFVGQRGDSWTTMTFSFDSLCELLQKQTASSFMNLDQSKLLVISIIFCLALVPVLLRLRAWFQAIAMVMMLQAGGETTNGELDLTLGMISGLGIDFAKKQSMEAERCG